MTAEQRLDLWKAAVASRGVDYWREEVSRIRHIAKVISWTGVIMSLASFPLYLSPETAVEWLWLSYFASIAILIGTARLMEPILVLSTVDRRYFLPLVIILGVFGLAWIILACPKVFVQRIAINLEYTNRQLSTG